MRNFIFQITIQNSATVTESNPAINVCIMLCNIYISKIPFLRNFNNLIFRFQVHFTINQLAVSGLKVNRLDMYGEKYKPFKGVKYITKAGKFQIRM